MRGDLGKVISLLDSPLPLKLLWEMVVSGVSLKKRALPGEVVYPTVHMRRMTAKGISIKNFAYLILCSSQVS